jgi:hypothetical protein
MCWKPILNEKKKHHIQSRISSLGERHVVLFQDETDLLLFPPLHAGWARRGQAAEVRISGRNARRVVFGTLSLTTGHRLFAVRHTQRAEDFQAFLYQVHEHYRGWSVVMLLDGDSSHTANGSQQLAATLDMELLWLPVRCPELNAIERLWQEGKKAICANRQYDDIDEQADCFIQYLQSLSPTEALRKAGILSANFWLKST